VRHGKELDEVHSGSCKKIMGIPTCAASGFAEIKLAESVREART
jgi:hypothetical protein